MFSHHTLRHNRPFATLLLTLGLTLALLWLVSVTWNTTNTVQAQSTYASHSLVSLTTDPTNVATVTGLDLFGIGVDPTTNRIYVANEVSHTVSVIDGASNTVVATARAGSTPLAST